MVQNRVKYSCLLLLFSLFSLVNYGQHAPSVITVKWKSPKKILDSTGAEIDVLNAANALYLSENNYLPAILVKIPGNVTDFTITPVSTELLTTTEQKAAAGRELPVKTFISLKSQYGKPVSFVYVVPLISKAGVISEKITSFEYSYHSLPVPSSIPSRLKLAAAATSSVLSSGSWNKMSVNRSGIFKVDYNMLQTMGINPATIDPRELKIYGNGGGMLPQPNSAVRYDDLRENAIYVHGEGDGVFNEDDYVLFYAKGPTTWTYDSVLGIFVHVKNIYSDNAYYFLTVSNGNGLRVSDQVAPASSSQTITTFDERYSYHYDSENIIHSGREWYGEAFDFTTQRSISVGPLSGITPGTTMKLNSSTMARSFSSSSFSVAINSITIGSQSHNALSNSTYAVRGNNNTKLYSINTNTIGSSISSLTYTYNKGASSSAIGYLNYFEINVTRDLRLYNNETAFRSVTSTSTAESEFIVANAVSGMMIWDVTDPTRPENINYTLAGSNASFLASTSTLNEYVAFAGSSFSNPGFAGQISNQDLHAIGTIDIPDMVIITAPAFLSSANRLAQFRNTNDNMDVTVVTTEQVYNEFSSGAQDLTAIRDFMKMLYDRRTATDSLSYLLLFGDGSYDYKNILSSNTNYVPIYESRESLHPISSHSSDDYFGFLETTEGNWTENSAGDHTLEIGIGRFPVKSLQEAEDIVNKVIHYSSNQNTLGKWRNKITFVADDGDGNLHLDSSESLAEKLDTEQPLYNLNKIYLDAYPQVATPGGETCPSAKEAITQAAEKGTFILNYTGHGGESGWSQEYILDIPELNSWNNYDKLPLFITATCEFGRYDDPTLVSGAEYSVVSNKGGSIALITSTRPVYSNTNYELNEAIYDCIFTPIGGKMPRLGDVMRITKNNSLSGVNNRNYALLGDPSLRLAYPEENIVLTKINGNPVTTSDTIRALGKVTLAGEIRDEMGAKINDFNGTVYITVFDKEAIVQTLGTQGSSPYSFPLRNNFIYEGLATATNGSFSLSFIVPKDISYLFNKGKISFYAKKDGILADASGFNSDIVIGGTDNSFTADNTPPQIKLFMNDESFVSGGLTGINSLFMAKLSDDNGINIAGQGIGHEITATLDNQTEVIVLNEYYTTEKDTFTNGKVEYPFKNLSPGNHSIKFKCWDTHNNSAESYMEFVVANDADIALNHVLNYPNPFSSYTTFHFDHNRAGEEIEVLVQIYTISGKLIKTLDYRSLSVKSHFSDLSWDARDDFGDKIGKGVYVYKVKIRSLRDGSQTSQYQKLVLLN